MEAWRLSYIDYYMSAIYKVVGYLPLGYFYSFFMFLILNPSDLCQFWLFIGLIIDNHNNIANIMMDFFFWSTQTHSCE